MQYKEFGSTGKKVSVLGFGGMRFDPQNEKEAVSTIHRAVSLGINYFDTAPGYCADKSETFIGNALAELPHKKQKEILISTKSHYRADPDADAVRKRIEGQLKLLQRDKIDFYNMWSIMDLTHFKEVMAPGGPYDGARKAQEEGLIDFICCSTHASGENIAAIVKEDVFAGYTLGYNIINHAYRQKGLDAIARAGRGVVTMNPLGGGILTRDAERLKVLQDDESDSYIAAALRFNLSNRHITIVLSGMKDSMEVEANVKTADSVPNLSEDTATRLKERFSLLGESFCTSCRYCLENCPVQIQIHLYAMLWDKVRMQLPEEARRIYNFYQQNEDNWFKGVRSRECTQCGECEIVCTQKLPIREYLQHTADFFDEQ